jgi:hypothetical protein
MSGMKWVAVTSYVLSSFFIVSAIVFGSIALFLGFRAMMENGASLEAAPTFWVAIPILTVISIALMRQGHGSHVHLGTHGEPAETFLMLTKMLSVQILFGLLGGLVLKRQGYFASYVFGPERSAGSYALVCPGVALSVLLQFYINKGLVAAGVLEKFSAGYWALTAVALLLQIVTILLVLRLNKAHFGGGNRDTGAQTSGVGHVA